jgi:hypothetical protein
VGNNNAVIGFEALYANTNGNSNTATGAGYNLNGSNDIDVGNAGVAGDSGVIRIGASAQTSTYVAGISTAHVTGAAVYVTSTGQLGVLASSERYKTAVASMGSSSAKLQQLRPVTFELKTDPQRTVQYGLIAEEVARVYPELVIRDESGQIQGVRYEELAPMLLNEAKQQKRLIQAQAARLHAVERQLTEVEGLNRAMQSVQSELKRLQAQREHLDER